MTDALSARFAHFAAETAGTSPLYAALSAGVAGDPAVLAVAAAARPGQPPPNLLFAAVQHLLRPDEPLAAWYPSRTAVPRADDPWPAFRAFVLEHADAIRPLLATRTVATNEVSRSLVLFPAFCAVLRRAAPATVHFVEFGASAGLNLLWPRMAFDYGDLAAAPPDPGLDLTGDLRGPGRPDLTLDRGRIGRVIGLELDPTDLADDDARGWLEALIWPEHHERRRRFAAAADLARAEPPDLRRGDALALLQRLHAELPPGDALCLFHSFALYQVPAAGQTQLAAGLADMARERPVFRIGFEGPIADQATVELADYSRDPTPVRLAVANSHGAWLAWDA